VCHAGAMDAARGAGRGTAAFASGLFCIYAIYAAGSETARLYYRRVTTHSASWSQSRLVFSRSVISYCEPWWKFSIRPAVLPTDMGSFDFVRLALHFAQRFSTSAGLAPGCPDEGVWAYVVCVGADALSARQSEAPHQPNDVEGWDDSVICFAAFRTACGLFRNSPLSISHCLTGIGSAADDDQRRSFRLLE
jgi:hypothetical protein